MGRLVGYHAGLAAEEIVAADYARRGLRLERRRWRGKRGEIDLIVREEDRVIFVEVKKSREFARAAESLSYRQMQRILGAAEEFVGHLSEDTRSVAGIVFSTNRAAVVQVLENLQRLGHDGVSLVALDVCHKADTAGIMLLRGVVKTADCCGV